MCLPVANMVFLALLLSLLSLARSISLHFSLFLAVGGENERSLSDLSGNFGTGEVFATNSRCAVSPIYLSQPDTATKREIEIERESERGKQLPTTSTSSP